ncbi:unnamed protein product [Somion occarium]|uniref:CAF1B/HIR1 beta-propeller domain-containing protein n=1 Tax=Somion occarium TaxID=3059160 RepID=A0ABP1DSV8_9APHY
MRVRTLEIRWHDSKPISTCDFQPVPFKKARPAQEKNFAGQSYKLATGGEDNHVRLWLVHPNILPQSVAESASTSGAEVPTPRPPRVEYLATLSRHSSAVNVVRWSPGGDLIASAGDDGMVIIWAPTTSPHATSYGSDLTPEELQYEKEHWKPRTTFRCTTMQVYDIAWSPTGEYLIAGSTDNCARIFTASEEHNHFVQGVAWDPLNEYVATQSSDRSMHVYSITQKNGNLEVHAVGKNTKMSHRSSRAPSVHNRPRLTRRESATSETESVMTSFSEQTREENHASGSYSQHGNPLLTPTASVPSTPSSTMFPPPTFERSHSRRSSFSGSNAANSPSTHARYARSPSPMPALPAIRMPPNNASSWNSVKLYGDESFTNFFRRLSFSPDGGLLLTPAGQFEDPSIHPGSSRATEEPPIRGRKGGPSPSTQEDSANALLSSSCVYIYSRANFARPPIARLPGHKKPSVAVKFSPILYELRPGVTGLEPHLEPKAIAVERGSDKSVAIDLTGPSPSLAPSHNPEGAPPLSPLKLPTSGSSTVPIFAPSPRVAIPPSPALSATDSLRAPTPLGSKPSTPGITPAPNVTSSLFALPYRMLYAVATMDTVTIYDTQQSSPVCLLTKLHYDEFTDMSWSPDGQCLILSSRDGYCTIVVFDEILATYHTQQQTLQFQSIAHHHSLPLTNSTVATPMSTPSVTTSSLPNLVSPAVTPVVPTKRAAEPPLTPAASVDENHGSNGTFGDFGAADSGTHIVTEDEVREPPRKKRRAALTRVADLD